MPYRPLQFNPDPLRVVDKAVREVWFRSPIDSRRWRCEHGDGRGRCASRVTKMRWNDTERYVECYCEKHWPTAELGPFDASPTTEGVTP